MKNGFDKLTITKRLLKFIAYQLCLLVTLLIVQIAFQFAQTHKWVGWVRKDQSSWIGIAEKAQAENWNCQQELEEMKKARDEANKDILE